MRFHQHLAVLSENLLTTIKDKITIFGLVIVAFVIIVITCTRLLTKA